MAASLVDREAADYLDGIREELEDGGLYYSPEVVRAINVLLAFVASADILGMLSYPGVSPERVVEIIVKNVARGLREGLAPDDIWAGFKELIG